MRKIDYQDSPNFRLQEAIPKDFFVMDSGYHDDKEPVAV